VALGGVALKPWRSRKVEASLAAGASAEEAADAELAGAKGRGGNDFKITLARRVITMSMSDRGVI
jgi:xanthine dehydrogenase YagS FAD-binding subunit